MKSGQVKKVTPKRIEEGTLPNIMVLYKELKQYIIGQEDALKKVVLSIYRNVDFEIKSNVLIIGKSGSGKTETMKQLADILGLPYTIEDATKYSKVGYSGASVEDMIFNLYVKSGCDLEQTEKGMLIIDEIDKKADPTNDKSDVANQPVLHSLLKVVEGTIIPIKEEDTFMEYVNTRKMIVVFMGAFEGLDAIREERLNVKHIGFQVSDMEKDNEKDLHYTKEDLIKYGLPAEFVGRLDTIIEYKGLTQKDLVNILKRSKLSIFKSYEQQFRKKGIILRYQQLLFKRLAQKALNEETGARELSKVVNEMFEEILFRVLSAPPGTYRECILKNEIATNPQAYVLR